MQSVWKILKKVFAEWQEDNVSQAAAALSYYTIFSLAPLLVIVIAVVGLFIDQATVQNQIIAQFQSVLGADTANLIKVMIEGFQDVGSGVWATVVSVGLLLFGATNLFFQLETTLNTIWDVDTPDYDSSLASIRHLIRKRLLSFGLILVIGILLIVSLLVNSLLSAFVAYMENYLSGTGYLLQAANILLSVTIITFLVGLVYRLLPDTKVAWLDVWIGALVTAILFTVGQIAIGAYLGRSTVTSAYGAAGSLAALLLWVYYSMQIVLIGAEFTQVYAHEYGSKKIGTLAQEKE